MKLKSFFIAALMLTDFAGNAWAQRDITSQYITNATLSDGTNGWTKSFTKTKQVTDPADAFSNSVQGNNTVGYASEAYAGWGELIQTAYSMKQTITLPAGNYRLVCYAFFRQGQAYNTNSSKSLAYLKAGSSQVALKTLGSITAESYADSQEEGANCFDSKMYRNVVEFTVAADNTQIEIGIEGTFDEMRSWCIVGQFELFDLNDLASVNSPTDMTYAITNPGFEYRNLSGWTTVQDNTSEHKTFWYMNNDALSNKAGIAWVETYQGGGIPDGRAIYQTLTGLENGLYEVTVYGHLQQGTGSNGFYLYANNDKVAIGNTDKDYSVRTTVTDNQLTIKLGTEGCNGNWAAFDKVRLKFYGDPLQAYKDLLADKVAEAQALVNGGTLRTGAANQLQTIINDNDNDDNAFTTEAEFNTAVSNIEAGMATANQIAAAYPAYDAYKAKFIVLENGVDDCTSKTTFDNAIAACDDAVNAATSAAAVNEQLPIIRSAAMTFISNTDDHQFDITFLASQANTDWKKKDGSAAGEVTWAVTNRGDWTFAESYEETCETLGTVLYQTVTDLPAGYYQVGMYAMAAYTPDRGFSTDATEGDADRSFAFAGNLNDATSILRTGIPIPFKEGFDFSELTTLDVNVHLSSTGNLTFGVQKDKNGSNWHFAQIASIVYSNTPYLTNLKATRDALVAEAEGLLNGSADYLTAAQQQDLQDAIDAGNDADDFDALNTATLTTLPNAINTAKQQIQQVKDNRVLMIAALERFENDYNLADGTDYRRLTMSAEAWATLITKVNAVSNALDDVSQATSYGTIKDALISQMNATDASLRLFKSYKAMSEGVRSFTTSTGGSSAATMVGGSPAVSETDSDDTEQAAITALNTAFVDYAATLSDDFSAGAFLGDNLDFSAPEGNALNTDNSNNIHEVAGWEVAYADADTWAVLQTKQANNSDKLYMRKNWGSASTTLTATKQKMLPVGKYQLSFSWNSTMENMENKSCYKLGDTSTPVGEATTEAKTLTYEFEVTGEPQPFDLTFGFRKTNNGDTPAQIVVDDVVLTYLQTTIALNDAADNSTTIDNKSERTFDVTLQGRTLFKDGSWNTLCLPFNTELKGVLADAELMELDTKTEDYDHPTGLDGSTLYLNFKPATSITAGTPYIIKWAKADNIVNPVFTDVTLADADAAEVKSSDEKVSFVGTYDPVPLPKDVNTNLYLDKDDTLCWPAEEGFMVNAFRAYFKLDDGVSARRFVLNFGDTATGIRNVEAGSSFLNSHPSSKDGWYSLDGRRLGQSPTKAGLYINNGKKVVIK